MTKQPFYHTRNAHAHFCITNAIAKCEIQELNFLILFTLTFLICSLESEIF